MKLKSNDEIIRRINNIPDNQPLIFLSSDHLIEKTNQFNKSIKQYQKY